MIKVIFSGYGIDIVEKNGEFFIKYDDGGLVSKEIESKITKEEAFKAQNSPEDASEVIISSQMRDGVNIPRV
ncbi:hypothetical protein N5923_08820 [Erwiniaceae bacterium BAC15a-03b]|uniref:Uncharacterized protein n=1 Tax=Winslowiella arboricola TaxID=2978220 RepID=A0A9J6PH10_9GAMM|nr:hypothetical protein [Winslowiella arboricola]MCU5771736.1 hypothetical protein [Winslowiella arboricola]MCU5777593.1 hypothetical protein [Winslowiella arboricola]